MFDLKLGSLFAPLVAILLGLLGASAWVVCLFRVLKKQWLFGLVVLSVPPATFLALSAIPDGLESWWGLLAGAAFGGLAGFFTARSEPSAAP